MMSQLEKAYAWDIKTRLEDQKFPVAGVKIVAKDMEPGVVYEEDGVKVTSFKVNHGELIDPAFGFRVDFAGRSVVLSGDTKYTDNLVKNAKDVDLLIHSVAVISPKLLQKSKVMRGIQAHHSSPEDTARVFNQTKPRLAVYSHVVFFGGLTEKDLFARVQARYKGRSLVGEDLMAIDVGTNSIKVRK